MLGADENDRPVAIPITGELDLHTFRPAEAGDLLEQYFAECRRRGILRVRVVHGKGTGTLRASVHAALRRSTVVKDYAVAGAEAGGWGATIVTLKRSDSC
jgi:DNA-nicking Smr family endonuclease